MTYFEINSYFIFCGVIINACTFVISADSSLIFAL